MGWETRGSHRYYYRKERRGGRVVSRYLGRGEWVDALARLDSAERRARDDDHAARMNERAQELAWDQDLEALGTVLDTLTTATLLLAGCHTHHGTWRKTRTP